MALGDGQHDPERIDRVEQTLREVQLTLQQITATLTNLTTRIPAPQDQPATQVNNQPPNRNIPPAQQPNRLARFQNQLFQPRNHAVDRLHQQEQGWNGEDSDLDEDTGDEGAGGDRHGRRRNKYDFDYRQRAKDVPSFNGSMDIETFLDWMSELENFFSFYEIPNDKRVTLVAYQLKGGAQAWWKHLQSNRERQGKLPISTWERMERELRKMYLPPNHDQVLFNLLQNCV